jgi:5-methyltetrahydrofolate--homocysteine methyltransferase
MIVIGEKINGSIPVVAKAIAERDADLIKQRAIDQDKAGATYIDCCASVEEDVEVETLKWMIDCIQEVSDLPIAVDSPSPKVLAEIYKSGICKKPGLINSVSGEGDKIDILFPLIADSEWEVVALLSDDKGIPQCAADRLRVFDNIMAKAKEYNIDPSRLHIDPLIEMLCTSEDGIAMVEEVMFKIREQYPTIHITGAVSNISFNLPYRKILNQSFTVLSMKAGLDSAIFDPLNRALMGLIASTEALMAQGEVTADQDLDAVAATLPEDQRKYLYPAYVALAMKAGIIQPEVDEEYDERDIEGLNEELKGKVDPEFGERDFIGLLYATDAMLGNDDFCMAYVGAFRDGMFGPQK